MDNILNLMIVIGSVLFFAAMTAFVIAHIKDGQQVAYDHPDFDKEGRFSKRPEQYAIRVDYMIEGRTGIYSQFHLADKLPQYEHVEAATVRARSNAVVIDIYVAEQPYAKPIFGDGDCKQSWSRLVDRLRSENEGSSNAAYEERPRDSEAQESEGG